MSTDDVTLFRVAMRRMRDEISELRARVKELEDKPRIIRQVTSIPGLSDLLPLDGSKAMTGDFDLADNKLLTSGLAFFEELAGSRFAIMDRTATYYKDIHFRSFVGDSTCYLLYLQAYGAGYDLLFKEGGGTEVAKVDSTNDLFTISKAGNIIPYSDNQISVGDASHKVKNLYLYNLASDMTVATGKEVDVAFGVLSLPTARTNVQQAIRYDAATDTLECYDGAAWHAH